MKKLLALALALVMVLSLCACGNGGDKNTEPSSTADGDTQTPTGSATDTTPSAGAPTDPKDTTPGTKPTAPAATTPAPTTCSHSWKAATCTAPKTCTKCNATEGNALGHDFKDGECTVCDMEDPNVPFSDNTWLLDALSGDQLNRIGMSCYKGIGDMSVSFWSENGGEGEAFQFGGKTYYADGFGKDAQLSYTEEGDTVKVTVSAYDGMTEGTMTLKRANPTQYTVTAVTGTIISDSITSAITVGSAFTVFILNIE